MVIFLVAPPSYFGSNMATINQDLSTITAYRVLLTFRGRTTFYENIGGGVLLLSSRIDIQGDVIFEKNLGVFGAGMAMSGGSVVSLINSEFDIKLLPSR